MTINISDTLVKNWKTSLAGVLSTVVAMSAAGMFAPNPFINTKVSGYLLAASGAARILLGFFQTDGVQVQVPSSSTIQQTTTIQTPPATGVK